MQRYFIPEQQMNLSSCQIRGQDAHHIAHVLRMKVDDQLICSDGKGRTVLARIVDVSKEEIECEITEELKEQRELPVNVLIAQGLPKADKLEWIVQKGTELGAHQFIPFSSARTIVKYDSKKELKKLERWKKMIKEAAEQAHRELVPEIHGVRTFKELLQMNADLKLVAYEKAAINQQSTQFYQSLKQLKAGQSVLIAIGPEGGFEEQEIRQFEQHGYETIALGKRILRTETASQYVLAAISFYFEQMGG